MIRFRCSHCKKKFGVPDNYAGKRIRCNTCDHHTIVPKTSTEPANAPVEPKLPKETSRPAPYHDKTDDDIVLILSKEDAPAAPEITSPEHKQRDGQTNPNQSQEEPLELQLQSFHQYHSPASDSTGNSENHDSTAVAANSGRVAAADQREVDGKSLKVRRRKSDVDRTEQALTILSYVSCIGPILFIVIIVHIMVALAGGQSPDVIGLRPSHHARQHAAAEPNTTASAEPNTVAPAEPNAVTTNNSTKTPTLWVFIRYAFYAFSYGISPMALVAAMFLVLKYCYDMPKTLYFSIVMHGLIFLNLFRG